MSDANSVNIPFLNVKMTTSSTCPSKPKNSDLWLNKTNGWVYLYFESSNSWIASNNSQTLDTIKHTESISGHSDYDRAMSIL